MFIGISRKERWEAANLSRNSARPASYSSYVNALGSFMLLLCPLFFGETLVASLHGLRYLKRAAVRRHTRIELRPALTVRIALRLGRRNVGRTSEL
jgi:hypothetical protein